MCKKAEKNENVEKTSDSRLKKGVNNNLFTKALANIKKNQSRRICDYVMNFLIKIVLITNE